jgi:hypothetical protein
MYFNFKHGNANFAGRLSFLFGRRILSKIYLLIKENGIWKSKVNDEVYKPRNEPVVVTVIRTGS